MTQTAEECVERGARLLDRQNIDWAYEIELGKLDISHCYECVLGQVYGSYLTGIDALEVDLDRLEELYYGFEIPYASLGETEEYPFGELELDVAWRREILRRLD